MYVIRHGQSVANAERVIAGQHESPLSELGVVEAQRAGQQAQAYHFDAIISSPMGRAVQTATIIAETIGHPAESIIVMEELRERFLGDIETKHYDETIYGNGNAELAEDVPNIEPLAHLAERLHTALERILELPAQNVLIVCHNGTGRMLQLLVRGGNLADFYEQPRMENATIYPLAAIGAPVSE